MELDLKVKALLLRVEAPILAGPSSMPSLLRGATYPSPRLTSQGERVAQEVVGMGTGARAIVVGTDVSDHEQVEAMVAHTIGEYAGWTCW